MSAGMKNIALMGATMMMVKQIDQEDTDVIMSVRLGFAAYVLLYLGINALLHVRVVSARDLTMLNVPIPQVPSLMPSPNPDGNGFQAKTQQSTVLAYDLNALSTARKSWMFNLAILTVIHFKTASVSPLIMSAVMGIARFFEDPLFKLHVLRHPSVGPLKRPFAPEANPLASFLQSMLPQLPTVEETSDQESADENNDSSGSSQPKVTGRNRNGVSHAQSRFEPQDDSVVDEDLHDDGNDDDDGEGEKEVDLTTHDESEDDDFKEGEVESKKEL